MTGLKYLLTVIALSVFHAPWAFTAQQELHVRSAHPNPRGELLVVVELPSGSNPKASDFHLLIDKKIVPAKEIHGQDLATLLLVDISGSMKGAPLNDAKAALSSLVKKAENRPKDRFQLVSFADEDNIVSGFEKSRQDLTKAVDGLKATGRTTKLYQAIYNSLAKLQDVDPGERRVFIVISDGKDEGSEQGMLEKAVEKAKNSGTAIHAVFRGEIEKQFGDVLLGLASATGGRFRSTTNREQLTTYLNEFYQLETRSFLITFTYDRDPSEKKTEAAMIEFRPAGGAPLRDKISAAIPMINVPPVIVPQPPAPYPIWLFLFLACMLLIGAIVIWRRKEKPSPIDEVFRDTSEPGPVVVSTPVREPSGPRHVATQVISYEFPAPQPGQPTAMLIGVGGPAEGQQYSMEREIFRIGAGAENDLSIEQDEYVSTQHAYLRYEKGSLFIFDQTSRNGTFVNDSQVGDIGLVLRPGDRIRVGMSIFEVATPSKS